MATVTADAATSYKDQGNAKFKAGAYSDAIECYTKAIEVDADNSALYSNRSVAYLKVGKVQNALQDAAKCTELKPEWDKGHFRLGAAQEELGEYDKALASFSTALDLNPGSREVALRVRDVKKIVTQKKKAAEARYSHMHAAFAAAEQAAGAAGADASDSHYRNGAGSAAGPAGGFPMPAASSWARGLSKHQRAEWVVDCYRMRVDDDYAWGGGNLHGLYDMDSSHDAIVEDFLIFTKLAVQSKVVPGKGWDWEEYLGCAAQLLPFAFEKSDAQEKWGGENVFMAAMGGRSLRATGEVVYGSSCMGGGERSQEMQELSGKVEGRWAQLVAGDGAMFEDVGGLANWRKLGGILRQVRR